MLYERPDQAEHKPESNLTWVRGRKVYAEVKMRETYFLFRNACWFKSLYLYKFQGKSKVSKKQRKCERRGISRTRERMRWTERIWQHKEAASESHVLVSDMYSGVKWNSWISVDFLPFSCRKQILKRTAIKLSRCIILQFIFQETDFIFLDFVLIFGIVLLNLFENPHLPSAYLQNFIRRLHKCLNIT